METTKQTVLHGWHVEQGANMALFGSYHMPLWYRSGTKAEHLAVINAAGIFDTSHMAVVSLSGRDARGLLQRCFSKDLRQCLGRGPLVDGRAVYGVFLSDDGTVIDDAIVCQLAAESYMVVVNASMGPAVALRLRENAAGLAVAINDHSDRVGKMDIQGPLAARILSRVLREPGEAFANLSYFAFRGGFGDFVAQRPVVTVDGTPLLLSRTGYTGEFGFELFVAIERLPALWEMVLAAGRDDGLLACGLAARDSLRAGAVLPLSHQDIGPWPFLNNPWQFALPWAGGGKAFTKEFLGGPALLAASWEKHTLPFAGFDARKIGAGEGSLVTDERGRAIGTILTCTTDMAIGRVGGQIRSVAEDSGFAAKGLCCGFVLLDEPRQPGDTVILSDGKRRLTVEIRADVRPSRTARRPMSAMPGREAEMSTLRAEVNP